MINSNDKKEIIDFLMDPIFVKFAKDIIVANNSISIVKELDKYNTNSKGIKGLGDFWSPNATLWRAGFLYKQVSLALFEYYQGRDDAASNRWRQRADGAALTKVFSIVTALRVVAVLVGADPTVDANSKWNFGRAVITLTVESLFGTLEVIQAGTTKWKVIAEVGLVLAIANSIASIVLTSQSRNGIADDLKIASASVGIAGFGSIGLGIMNAGNLARGLNVAGAALLIVSSILSIVSTVYSSDDGKLSEAGKIVKYLEISLQGVAAIIGAIALALGPASGGTSLIIGAIILTCISPVAVNSAVEGWKAADEIREQLEVYKNHGFSGYDVIPDLYDYQSDIAMVSAFGLPIALTLFAPTGGLSLLALLFFEIFKQNILELEVDKKRREISNEYGSFRQYWSSSYAAEWSYIWNSTEFKSAVNEISKLVISSGGSSSVGSNKVSAASSSDKAQFQQAVFLMSMTNSDAQLQAAGMLREGESLPAKSFMGAVIDGRGIATTNTLLIDSNSGVINLKTNATSQYVTSYGTLLSPSIEYRERTEEEGKNNYKTTLTLTPKSWHFKDGDASTVLNIKFLSLPDNGANAQDSALLDMGGGNDTIIAGGRKFSGDLGTGFNGLDYSQTFSKTEVASGSNTGIRYEEARNGDAVVTKWGWAPVAVESISTKEVSYSKRKEKIEYLSTSSNNTYIYAQDHIKSVQWIRGTWGNDKFYGNWQDSYFVASGGDDFYSGGRGSNWVDYSVVLDWTNSNVLRVLLDPGQASSKQIYKSTNFIQYGVGLAIADGTTKKDTFKNINNIRGTTSNDLIAGNNNNNILVGNGGNDSLYGFGGIDTLITAETGNSFVDGGTGINLLDYASFQTPFSVKMLGTDYGQVTKSNSDIDRFINIQQVRTGDGNDTLVGGAENDIFLAQGGNDSISSGGGNDVIVTGTGTDTVVAGSGDDVIYVTHQGPAIKGRYVMIRKNIGVNEYLSIAELQVFSNGQNIALNTTTKTSGSFDQTNHKASNMVDGDVGGEVSINRIFASSTKTNGWIQIDLGSSFNIDHINVYGRTDAWASENGNYTMYVSDTDLSAYTTTQIEHMGNVLRYRAEGTANKLSISQTDFYIDTKSIDGGSGTDMVNYASMLTKTGLGIEASLRTGEVKTWFENGTSSTRSVTDKLSNIENLGGTAGNDSITGDNKTNKLLAFAGNDTVYGLGGNDTIETGTGNDSIYAGDGNDVIIVTHAYKAPSARYVMLRKNSGITNLLAIAEVQIFSGTENIALNKTVTTSGAFNTKPTDVDLYQATNAIDGNTDGIYSIDGIFASSNQTDAWIQIDLGRSFDIDQINIFGRTDSGNSLANQNGDYTIYISNTNLSTYTTTAQIEAVPDVRKSRVDGNINQVTWNLAQYFTDSKWIDGGNGSNAVDYSSLTTYGGAGIEADLSAQGANVKTWRNADGSINTNSSSDTLIHVNRLAGTNGNDKIKGNNEGNILAGYAGNDYISGGDGTDHIATGTGNDTVYGMRGDDTIYIDHDRGERSTHTSKLKGYAVRSRAAKVADTWQIEDIDFNNPSTQIIVNSFRASIVQQTTTRLGQTELWVEYSTGISMEAAQLTLTNSSDGGMFASVTSAKSTSSAVAEQLNDWYLYGPSNTTWVDIDLNFSMLNHAFSDVKTIDGGVGSDTVDYYKMNVMNNNGILIDISSKNGFAKTWRDPSGNINSNSSQDTLLNIENMGGTEGFDRLIGNDGDNTIYGYGGSDSISAGEGDDVVYTGLGNDTVDAGAGNDSIIVSSAHMIQDTASGFNTMPQVFTNLYVGDFNGDGKPDTLRQEKGSWAADTKDMLQTYLSDGQGSFTKATTDNNGNTLLSNGSPSEFDGNLTGLYVGDFNGDGTDDMLRQEQGSWANGTSNMLQVYLSDGKGGFKKATTDNNGNALLYNGSASDFSGDFARLYVGDFNGDGTDDMLRQEKGSWANDISNMLQVYLSDGKGGFKKANVDANNNALIKSSSSTYKPRAEDFNGDICSLYTGDFNGDGIADVLRQRLRPETGGSAVVQVFFGDGKGGFDLAPDTASNGTASGLDLLDPIAISGAGYANYASYTVNPMYVADFDGDGKADVLNGLQIYFGNGLGGFRAAATDAQNNAPGLTSGKFNVADFNGDGFADILSQSGGYSIQIFLGDGHGGFSLAPTDENGNVFFSKLAFDSKVIDGGYGNDTVDYRQAQLPDTVGLVADLSNEAKQTVQASWQAGGPDSLQLSDQLSNIEGLGGTDADDKITGSDKANKLWGYAGNDTINSGAGDDIIYTGSGNDRVNAGDGDDVIYVEHQRTKINWSVKSYLQNSATTLSSVGCVADIDFNDAATSITLNGGSINSDQTAKIVSADTSVQGQVSLWAQFWDGTYTKAVQIQLTDLLNGGVSIKLVKAAYIQRDVTQETFDWNTDTSVVSASVATSSTAKGYGVSNLNLVGLSSFIDSKTIDGGNGIDFVSYRAYEDKNQPMQGVGIKADLSTGTVNTWIINGTVNTSSTNDVINNIENLGGTEYADLLIGSNANNQLGGFEGNDTINGGKGNDTLSGGADSNIFNFDADFGSDTITEAIDPSSQSRYSYTDDVNFGSGISYADLWFQKSGIDLKVNQLGTSNQLTISGWYSTDVNSQTLIHQFSANGRILTQQRVQTLVDAMASNSIPSTSIGNSSMAPLIKQKINTAIASGWL